VRGSQGTRAGRQECEINRERERGNEMRREETGRQEEKKRK
jgi:hypothetical protein